MENKYLSKQAIKSNKLGRNINSEELNGISVDLEWIKWISYSPKFEKKKMKKIFSKKVEKMGYRELIDISKYKKRLHILNILNYYSSKKCSDEEYSELINYLNSEDIEELMLDKLTVEEYLYARERIKEFSDLSKEELIEKINYERIPNNYMKLNMIDSYILHELCKIVLVKSNSVVRTLK